MKINKESEMNIYCIKMGTGEIVGPHYATNVLLSQGARTPLTPTPSPPLSLYSVVSSQLLCLQT